MSTIFWLKTLTARFENRPDYLRRVLSQEIYLLYIRFQRLLDFKAYRKDWLCGQPNSHIATGVMLTWILFSYFSFATTSPQFETYERNYKVIIPSGPTISVVSKCKQEINMEGGPWCDHTLTTETKKIEIKNSRVSKFLLASGDKSISLVGYRPGCCSDSDFIHFFSEDMKDIGHIRYDGTHDKELSGSLKLSNFSKNSFVISESDLNKAEFDYKLVTKINNKTLVSEKLNIPPLESECWFTIDKSIFSNNSLELTFVGHACEPTLYKVICSKASSKWNCHLKN